ncbi:MAG: DUF4236 domain-containing protein [Ruminococcus sp.]|uniref:DUF4236 domain-containing protein n=1 Tax=Ruminococcus sp. TaxID=41978 RepID=UPI002872CB92|nr:DUF4236 domain-containing protein [Ruminococcus sp.]MBQ3285646.1 DUF4236 domain-containing protein [Ruminococcus sp.]
MGLRFRKTITLLPGVRLNISKSGLGLSAGVPGLRGSINTSGRVTGTASIPGTGVSYQKSKTLFGKKKKTDKAAKTKSTKAIGEKSSAKSTKSADAPKKLSSSASVQIDENTLKSIHNTSDEKIDWKKLAQAESAEGFAYDEETWEYLHNAAPAILKGDIDTYLQLIFDVNPLDDLLDYGSNFEFGTDNPTKIEVEFVINDAALSDAAQRLNQNDYNALLQDFVCSMSLRIARDMFALLPVQDVIVHTVLDGDTIFSVDFNIDNFSKINFGYIDASNTATKFRNNMSFDPKKGFAPVNRV